MPVIPFPFCVPDVKRGNVLAADYVLRHLGITTDTPWSGSYTKGGPVWGVAHKEHNRVKLSSQKLPALAKVPDVKGMGARDAVYLLESRGIKVRIGYRVGEKWWSNRLPQVAHAGRTPSVR